MQIYIPTTLGDALDRLSILQIKHDKNLPIDTGLYMELLQHKTADPEGYSRLYDVNSRLWVIEDSIRDAHSQSQQELIVELSYDVIKFNKLRSQIKEEIDVKIGHTPDPKLYHTISKRESCCKSKTGCKKP